MPAFVNRSVGSLAGTSEEECTSLCPFCTKKSTNFLRICDPVGMKSNFKRSAELAMLHEEKGTETGISWDALCPLRWTLQLELTSRRPRSYPRPSLRRVPLP